MNNGDPIKFVIGSDENSNNPSWIETQESELELLWGEDWESKFKVNSLDAILAEYVWEHLTYEEGKEAALNCIQYEVVR